MKTTLSCLLTLLGTSYYVQAWDHTGHMLVAEIASSKLTPQIRAKVDADLAKFNARYGVQYNMTTAACWMDDVRGATEEYDQWHFINIPLHHPTTPDKMKQPNAASIAQQCIETIQSRGSFSQAHDGKPIDEPQALVMLLHITGDLHQPLHGATNSDAGGNGVKIGNMSESNLKQRNLHHFWDTAYRRDFNGGSVVEQYSAPFKKDLPGYKLHALAQSLVTAKAGDLAKDYSPLPLWQTSTPSGWADEGFSLASSIGYGKLPEGADDKQMDLTATYVTKAQDQARRRIVLGGLRLAKVLTDAYSKQH